MLTRYRIGAVFSLALFVLFQSDAGAHDLPNLGTNSYVKYNNGSECLAILDTEWKADQQQQVSTPYMDDYLLSGVPQSGAWLGLVSCDDFFDAYRENKLEFYNQRMAIWWRTSESAEEDYGRLHSWVQNYGCLSVPSPNEHSIKLENCEDEPESPLNKLEFIDGTGKIELKSGDCLVPSETTVSWPTTQNADRASLNVRPVLPGNCTAQLAGGWSFSHSEVVTYPMPDIHAITTNAAYAAFLFDDQGNFSEPSAGYYYYCPNCYAPPHGEPSANYYSWYTPFSIYEDQFPVKVKVCSLEGHSSKGAVVMSLDQANRIRNVTEPLDNCVQFDLHSYGQVSIVFPEEKPDDHLALFIDPFEPGRGDLKGCTAEGPCPDGTYFIGPGYYTAASPMCADHLGAGSGGQTQLTSPVDIELAGGAVIECRVNADVGQSDGDGSTISLHGKGVIDGSNWLGLGAAPPPLLHACADSVEIDGIVIGNPPGRTQGNLTANSPWMCTSEIYEKGQVHIQYAKQIAGFEGQADGFDVGSNSHIDFSFIESNDDGIKMIGSNQTFTNMTIWKNQYGWAVDCGWGAVFGVTPLIDSVTVTHVDIPFIKQPDKQCCNESSCPASNPSCPGYNGCQDQWGKVAAIGCQIGENVKLTNYSISHVTVRNPINATNSTPVNLLQRGFAIGMADNLNSGHVCPVSAELLNLSLSHLYFPAAQSPNRFFVDSGPDAEIQGTFNHIYQNCPEPGVTTTGCVPVTDEEILKYRGVNEDGVIDVPEPASFLSAWACLFALGALCSRRRSGPRGEA